MGKDPAFLFYFRDFLVSTSFMTFEELGAHIKLLCFLADKNELSETEILKKIPLPIWESIRGHYRLSKENKYYNERLQIEMAKRVEFTKSRLKNLHKEPHLDTHMEPHMVNGNANTDATIKESDFIKVWEQYPKRLGRKSALKHFLASVKTQYTFIQIEVALKNYLSSDRVKNGYIQNGSTWFNNWQDWVDYKEEPKDSLTKAQRETMKSLEDL